MMAVTLLLLWTLAALCLAAWRSWPHGTWIAYWALGLIGAWVLEVPTVVWLPALTAWLVLLVLGIGPLRRAWVSGPLMRWIQGRMPPMSETERVAVDAGGVGWEGSVFAGAPEPLGAGGADTGSPSLSPREEAFLQGPVRELCEMLDDWAITQSGDLPPEVWQFIKAQRFFGLIIPESYGGHGFSVAAHSAVVQMLAARSGSACVTVMVPNSLGPAELLLHYGTEEQRAHYLPRLAQGEEIPCFALTSPWAGSDAGAIPDAGVVCRGRWQGRETLGFRVSWDKRYITLAPVATVLGLAFRARDPEGLLGQGPEPGITCALIPTDTPGVEIGHRHRPLQSAFMNGPTRGRDVFVPMDWIIGGREGVGQGWRMLMESLAAGRGISLPALSCGTMKLCLRMTSAYVRVRRQFHRPIGDFEGVQEAVARMAGLSYRADAVRELVVGELDRGERPAVATAMAKLYTTESMRRVVNAAMDVHGGRAICIGPRNYMAAPYAAVPIAITVEGANILTRSMIVFGQGALRCHPYLRREIEAAQTGALAAFDTTLDAHLGHVVRNLSRALLGALTGRAWWLEWSTGEAEIDRAVRRLARYSAAFAWLADVVLAGLGGALKRREMLSGRFADALAALYALGALVHRRRTGAWSREEAPVWAWAVLRCYADVERALDGVIRNFGSPWLRGALRMVVFPLGRRARHPDDALERRVASAVVRSARLRARLTEGIWIAEDPEDVHGRLEWAYTHVQAVAELEQRLQRAGFRPAHAGDVAWIDAALDAGAVTPAEAEALRDAHRAVAEAIRVDEFPVSGGHTDTHEKEAA